MQSTFSQLNFHTIKYLKQNPEAGSVEVPKIKLLTELQAETSHVDHVDFLSGLVKQSVTSKLEPIAVSTTSQVKIEARVVKPESKLSRWASSTSNNEARIRKFAVETE